MSAVGYEILKQVNNPENEQHNDNDTYTILREKWGEIVDLLERAIWCKDGPHCEIVGLEWNRREILILDNKNDKIYMWMVADIL